MLQKSISKKPKSKLIFVIPGILFVTAISLLILEKLHITNFYTNNSNSSTSTPVSDATNVSPTNAIDYTPAKPEDTTTVPDKSQTTNTVPPVNSALSATITSTRNNSANTDYLIKVAVTGTDTGNCAVTMSKGSKTFTSNTGISLSAGQYSCTDLSIPLSSLNETGTWMVDVTVTDKSGATASTSTEAIL